MPGGLGGVGARRPNLGYGRRAIVCTRRDLDLPACTDI